MGCTWTWIGDKWELTEQDCPNGAGDCTAPTANGAFIGQTFSLPCADVNWMVALAQMLWTAISGLFIKKA